MSKIRYIIGLDVENSQVIVYPSWKGLKLSGGIIGEYTPPNPRASLDDYLPKLMYAVKAALEQDSMDPIGISVRIVPLDGSTDVHKSLI